MPNAPAERRPTGTESRLSTEPARWAVRCRRLIMIEASPSAYHRGRLALGNSLTHSRGGDLLRCYTEPHQVYCGSDLHARSMSVGVLRHDGELVLHRHMNAAPDAFLTAVAPSRGGLVVAVAGLFTWAWLAALGADQGLPFVLGHALSMQALHGGQAKHDQRDSHKIAALRRGGLLPQASVSPARMRATRALLRRRTHLRRKRSALLAHVQHTTSPDTLPEIGQKRASTATREGGLSA
jgi:hypothetical protein